MTLPLDPLWAYVAARHRPVSRGPAHARWTCPFTAVDLAEEVGVSQRQVHRWRAQGLSWMVADRVAVALGTHPAIVWGNAFWDEPEQTAARERQARHRAKLVGV